MTETIVRELSEMQVAMGNLTDSGKNVILLSPTGTGKTLAYLLPLVRRLEREKGMAIVVLPTRELARQVSDVFASLRTSLPAVLLSGGHLMADERNRLNALCPRIVFATPGRLLDHLSFGSVSPQEVSVLVLDEFDKCISLGFREDIWKISTMFLPLRQVLLVSATEAVEDTGDFGQHLGMSFTTLDFLPNEADEANMAVEFFLVRSPLRDKLSALSDLLLSLKGQPAMVFVAHRESVERVNTYLLRAGFDSAGYHGGLEQEQRERALFRFRTGCANVLVATDVAARGLDIPEVRAVVHYHLPVDELSWTHRNGRTSRWESSGNVFLICGSDELPPSFVDNLKEYSPSANATSQKPASAPNLPLYIGRGRKDGLCRGDIVGFLCRQGRVDADSIRGIELFPHAAYVAVSRHRVPELLREVSGAKIKKMKTLIERMRT